MTVVDQRLRSHAPASVADVTFRSLLFPPELWTRRDDRFEAPACFIDLNLDQIVDAIVARRDEATLRPIFYTPYHNEDIVRYRQDVFRNVEVPAVFAALTSFCDEMHRVRIDVGYADQIQYLRHKHMVLLRARSRYCTAVSGLLRELKCLDLHSRGLRALRSYLTAYASSERFLGLAAESHAVHAGLSAITYGMLFRGDKVIVRKYDSEPDYATMVLERFARFSRTATETQKKPPIDEHGLNHIEEAILEHVGQLFPEPFQALEQHVERFQTFIDDTVARVDRELGFFLAFLAYLGPLKDLGLPFCYPAVSTSVKETVVVQGFDLGLAQKLRRQNSAVVCNDFALTGAERIIVVSGPNQGGKTTFARMFGQIHYLAGLGCPVPGREARLFLPDRVFTHFERSERLTNLRSKLEDELIRLKATCDVMTADSVVVLNEIFTSTGLDDQKFLSTRILDFVLATDALCLCVTFIDALASLNERVVSMVSLMSPDDPARRTFRIQRKPADGLAYAVSLAEKHGVTYDRLRRRILP